MNANVKIEPAAVASPTTPATPSRLSRIGTRLQQTLLQDLLPPLVILLLLGLIWEMLCSGAGAALPPPSQVLSDTWELIVDPFYDNGGNDVGLAWQLLASLQRVAVGYLLAVVAGVALGVLIGQSDWAMRGLDPLSQVIQLNAWEYFRIIMLPAAAPYIFTGLRIGVGLSWLAIIAAEMLIGGVGIGFFIWDAWNASRISDIILALVYIGVVGFFLDRLVAFAGRRITRGIPAA